MQKIATNETSTFKKVSNLGKRLSLLRRMGMFATSDYKGFSIKRASTIEELKAAYTIVHNAFVEQEYMVPTSNGMRIRPYEQSKNITTFIASTENQNVEGVISLVQDSSELGLPSENTFSMEIAQIRKQNSLICEVTNQAITSHYRNRDACMATQLMQAIFAQAIAKNCTDLIIAVSPSLEFFYKDVMTFERISEIKNYSKEIYDPVVLLWGDVRKFLSTETVADENSTFIKNYLVAENPFIHLVKKWENETNEILADVDLISAFNIAA